MKEVRRRDHDRRRLMRLTLVTVAGMLSLGLSTPAWAQTRFAYVANNGSNNVSAYAIDLTTGALAPIDGSPFAAETKPSGVAADPFGRFLYVTNHDSNNISAYEIDPETGVLTPIDGSPFPSVARPVALGVDFSGRYLYGISDSTDQIDAFRIDPDTGALTRVGMYGTGADPQAIAAHPVDRFSTPPLFCSSRSGSTPFVRTLES